MPVDWLTRLRRVAVRLDEARVARNEAIVDAHAAGVTQVDISKAVGLSRMQVIRILKAAAEEE